MGDVRAELGPSIVCDEVSCDLGNHGSIEGDKQEAVFVVVDAQEAPGAYTTRAIISRGFAQATYKTRAVIDLAGYQS